MLHRILTGPLLTLTAVGFLAAQDVPTPESHFGYEIGSERRLANWTELTSYYERLAQTSERVKVDTLGLTTMGRPFVMLTVTSEENQARLTELYDVQMKLADPRLVSGEEELERLLELGRTVVLITHSIHSTEVGGAQMAARLLHRLASSDDEQVREILDNVILLDIPSLNPDGTEWVVDWYGEDYYAQSPERDPQGPDAGISRVLRGGSMSSDPYRLRGTDRSGLPPTATYLIVGFRCAASALAE